MEALKLTRIGGIASKRTGGGRGVDLVACCAPVRGLTQPVGLGGGRMVEPRHRPVPDVRLRPPFFAKAAIVIKLSQTSPMQLSCFRKFQI